ncbi:MAG: MgtC/SapB family protein [Clostridia bacterium]|nr:MgtC/SapB family protein [Clostridia bacterium]
MLLSAITITSIDVNDHIVDVLLRILVAAVCGFAIGYERTARSKEVGIRTHTIVCLAAALMMVVSKYGFTDLLDANGQVAAIGAGTRGADPARIAAQIVSGIGFLGAGIIIYRRDMLHGLTTAAGIWLTAGIGMAIGAGMYVVGVIATILLIVLQILLHRQFKTVKKRMVNTFRMTLLMEDGVIDKINEIFEAKKILKFKTAQHTDGSITADVELLSRKPFTEEDIYKLTKEHSFILQLEKTDEA